MRVRNNQKFCKWQVRFNNQECQTPLPITATDYALNGNDHRFGTVIGACTHTAAGQLKAGTHTVRIYVTGNGGDCYTGWQTSALLTVEEVKLEVRTF